LTLRRFDGEGAGCHFRLMLVHVDDTLVHANIMLLSFDIAIDVDWFGSGYGLVWEIGIAADVHRPRPTCKH
jgi:hypothetical protein